MKARDLKKLVNSIDDDADICALVWEKFSFDYPEDEELVLTDAVWQKVCDEFDETEFIQVGEWIADTVVEYCELRDALPTI